MSYFMWMKLLNYCKIIHFGIVSKFDSKQNLLVSTISLKYICRIQRTSKVLSKISVSYSVEKLTAQIAPGLVFLVGVRKLFYLRQLVKYIWFH